MDADIKILLRAAQECIPLYTSIDVTYRCNLKCVHCFQDRELSESELSLVEIRCLLHDLAELGCIDILISGGEPLTRPDLMDILREVRSIGFGFALFTNATLVTPDFARDLSELMPMLVGVSVYGASARTHDSITQVAGSFSRTIAGIRLLKEAGVRTSMKFLIMKDNVDEIEDVEEMAQTLGVRLTPSMNITVTRKGLRHPLMHRLDIEEAYEVLSGAVERYGSDDVDFEDLKPKTSPANLMAERPLCLMGRNRVHIEADGIVYPCMEMPICVGSIREQGLREIWHESAELQRLRALRLSESDCAGCEMIKFCSRCPGRAYVEEGNLFAVPRYTCNLERVKRKALSELLHRRKEV